MAEDIERVEGYSLGGHPAVGKETELEREGVIAKKRARIVITNRKALEKRANGTYVPADYR